MQPVALYTDGGIVGKNPSVIGGTWAFAHVGGNDPMNLEVIYERSGVLTTAEAGLEWVENNLLETVAILYALESVPPGWAGFLYGDNLNSIRRASEPKKAKFGGVPPAFSTRLIEARRVRPHVEFVLVGGHPTRDELAAGRRRDGKLVSEFNVRCDKLCQKAAADYLSRREPPAVVPPTAAEPAVPPRA